MTSDPPGICTYPFPPNTTVVLTAVPVASSAFQGWDLCSLSSGDCDGGNGGCTGATCSVTLSDDVTLEANFAAAPARVEYLAVTW